MISVGLKKYPYNYLLTFHTFTGISRYIKPQQLIDLKWEEAVWIPSLPHSLTSSLPPFLQIILQSSTARLLSQREEEVGLI